jgi:hypothetical protein
MDKDTLGSSSYNIPDIPDTQNHTIPHTPVQDNPNDNTLYQSGQLRPSAAGTAMSCTGCGLLERRVLEGDALNALRRSSISGDTLSRASSPNGNVSEIQHMWPHDMATVTRTTLTLKLMN